MFTQSFLVYQWHGSLVNMRETKNSISAQEKEKLLWSVKLIQELSIAQKFKEFSVSLLNCHFYQQYSFDETKKFEFVIFFQ